MKRIIKKSTRLRKSDVWKAYSLYIRLKYADENGYVKCVTCDAIKHYKQMQAGHFIPGRHNSVLFDDRNCHPQCYHCNIGLKGNPRKYDKFMRETYGREVIEDLETLDSIPKQLKNYDLAEIVDRLKHS